jgi:hypothetical protein
MADNSDEESLRDPYRDDPKWEPWHADAVDVVGGPDDDSSSEEYGLHIEIINYWREEKRKTCT